MGIANDKGTKEAKELKQAIRGLKADLEAKGVKVNHDADSIDDTELPRLRWLRNSLLVQNARTKGKG
jgi:hypothetical protein